MIQLLILFNGQLVTSPSAFFLFSPQVRNGPDGSSPLLGERLCGSSPPPLLQTTDNHLYIFFASDASNEGSGFKLTFEAHSQGTTTTLLIVFIYFLTLYFSFSFQIQKDDFLKFELSKERERLEMARDQRACVQTALKLKKIPDQRLAKSESEPFKRVVGPEQPVTVLGVYQMLDKSEPEHSRKLAHHG